MTQRRHMWLAIPVAAIALAVGAAARLSHADPPARGVLTADTDANQLVGTSLDATQVTRIPGPFVITDVTSAFLTVQGFLVHAGDPCPATGSPPYPGPLVSLGAALHGARVVVPAGSDLCIPQLIPPVNGLPDPRIYYSGFRPY